VYRVISSDFQKQVAEKGHRRAINNLAELCITELADYIRKRDIHREIQILIEETT
jgi:hypothetical protein